MVWRVEQGGSRPRPALRRQAGKCVAPGALPAKLRIYAIGDVHGCAAQLARLHGMIAAHLAANPIETAELVHLGDYVDRGPDSAGVVAMLSGQSPVAGTRAVYLIGNHERTMLDALDGDGAAAADWLFNGGRETLASWGLDPSGPRAGWRRGVPASDRAWLGGLELSYRAGSYLFVHAGVRPGVSLDRQTADDLTHMRQTFLGSDADFGAIVVHGHTVKWEPVVRPNRIGIDTGAVFGGALTCVALEGDTMEFLQVEGHR